MKTLDDTNFKTLAEVTKTKGGKDLPAGELGVDELQLEVFDEESICIEGLYPTPC